MFSRCSLTIVIQSFLCLAFSGPSFAGFAGTDVFLPSVGAGPGVPPSVWYTTVWVHNPETTAANITVYLLERQANVAPLSFTDTIEPGDTRKYDDAVQLMFGKQVFGALRLTSNLKVIVSSRIYSQEGTAIDDSNGQFFAGVPASFAIGAGEQTQIIGADQTQPADVSDFRFNFGFVEVTGAGSCQVKVTVKDSTGATIGSKTYEVRRWEQVQKSLAGEFAAISSGNARLTVEVLSGTGKVIAFGSSIANESQDPSTLEMAFADSLLTENSTAGITGLIAGMGLSGGGTTGSVTLNVGAGNGLEVDDNTVGLANRGVTKGKLEATGGTDGQVLGTDGDRLRWQLDNGLVLPFEGTTNTSIGGALKVTNTSSGDFTYGVEGYGRSAGGYFESTNGDAFAKVGGSAIGVLAQGDSGGFFINTDNTGLAYVGTYGNGIQAFGKSAGGEFGDSDGTGRALVASTDYGIIAYGNYAGGFFEDTDSSAWADVAFSSYKINGNGTVSFVQNHPRDPGSVIVYAAPEGDEVATYTRGTARLVDGEAKVPLGETFRWVTNPDIGLTTYLTPVGEFSDLYVAEKDTGELVVRSAGGARDATFDYMVYGLRIGFEGSSIVQEKEREAYIPSMADHRQLYERRPDLEGYNSLERFKKMRIANGDKSELDLSQAHALRDAIVEFDPEVHELPGDHERVEPAAPMPEEATTGVRPHVGDQEPDEKPSINEIYSPEDPGLRSAESDIPVDSEGNIYATSFRPASRALAGLMEVSESVVPGEVLVIDRTRPGMMRRSFEASDGGVVGVVVHAPGIVLGTQAPPSEISEPRGLEHDEIVFGDSDTSPRNRVSVALAGIVSCRVDATFGAIWPGDLLVTSPTPGHAMRTDAPLPGTMLGKALEPLQEDTGLINVLVLLQ